MNQSQVVEDLRRDIASGRVLAVIGAGVSIRASDNPDHASWVGLLKNGIRRCIALSRATEANAAPFFALVESSDIDNLIFAAERVKKWLGAGEYARWLRDTVGSLKLIEPDVLNAIAGLDTALATTNYDNLIEEATGLAPVTWQQQPKLLRVLQREDDGVIHLHGHYETPESVIFGVRSYERIIHDDAAQSIQQAFAVYQSLLFIGCGAGLEDSNIGQLLQWTAQRFPSAEHRHYRLALDSEVVDFQQQHQSDQHVIVVGYGKVLNDLPTFLSSLSRGTPPQHSRSAKRALPAADNLRPPERPRPWHNLPRPNYATFVGRGVELGRLAKLLAPSHRSFIVALEGIGGVGKSALAQKFARELTDRYGALPERDRFDVIVWVSAKQSELTVTGIRSLAPTLSGLSDVFRAIVTVLDEPGLMTFDADLQAEHVKKALSRHRALLIFDNFESINEPDLLAFIEDLPAPTKVLITSRVHIDGASSVKMTGMPPKEAVSLVRHEMDRTSTQITDKDIDELVKRSGGVPLAIVWSIGLMSAGHAPDKVLVRLGNCESDISKFCFKASLEHVRNEGADSLLFSLAFFEASVRRKMLCEVAGLGDDRFGCDDKLATLMRLSLVSAEEHECVNMLPLTRSYLLSELRSEPERQEALTQSWVTCLVAKASPFNKPRWLNRPRAELRQEGVHLVTLAKWCQQQPERMDTLLAILPALREYYDLTGLWAERFRISKLALEEAELRGASRHVISIKISLAWMVSQQGRHDTAKQYVLDALSLAKQVKDHSWICEALIISSVVFRRSGDNERALEQLEEAQSAFDPLPEPDKSYVQGWIEYERGFNARDACDWRAAHEHLINARSIFTIDDVDNPPFSREFAWLVQSNLGYVEHRLGNLDIAEDIYERALQFFREIGSKGQVASLLTRLAGLCFQRGNVEIARRYAAEAKDWSDRLDLPKIKEDVDAMLSV